MQVCLLTSGHPDPEDPVHDLLRVLGDDAHLATSREEALERAPHDVVVAMDWRATAVLFAVPATRRAYRVTELAHDRLGQWNAARVPAALSYDLPADLLVAEPWLERTLQELRPEARVVLVPDGVERERFVPGVAAGEGPLRVLVLGEDPGAVEAMAEPAVRTELPPDAARAVRAAAYAEADVLLALDPVGVPAPRLHEARAAGLAVVVLPAGGHEDVVSHAADGVLVDFDDVRGTARWLDHLARDRALLAELQDAAQRAAGAAPSWGEAGAQWRAALERLVAEEPPPDAAWPSRLMSDALAASALWHQEHHKLSAVLEHLEADEAFRLSKRLRASWEGSPKLRPVRKVAGPVVRRSKRRLLG